MKVWELHMNRAHCSDARNANVLRCSHAGTVGTKMRELYRQQSITFSFSIAPICIGLKLKACMFVLWVFYNHFANKLFWDILIRVTSITFVKREIRIKIRPSCHKITIQNSFIILHISYSVIAFIYFKELYDVWWRQKDSRLDVFFVCVHTFRLQPRQASSVVSL